MEKKSLAGFRQFILSKNPNISKTQLSRIDEFIQMKAAEQIAETGVPISDIQSAPDLRLLQAAQAASGEYKSPEQSKIEQEGGGVLGLIDTLKGLYNQPTAEGASPIEGRGDLSYGKEGVPSMFANISTGFKIALNQAPTEKTYQRLKEGFTASLKEATGDTGVLTDKDYDRIAKTMPDFGDSDESARQAWESIDRILMAKFGRVGKYSYLPAEQAGQIINEKQSSNINDPLGLGL